MFARPRRSRTPSSATSSSPRAFFPQRLDPLPASPAPTSLTAEIVSGVALLALGILATAHSLLLETVPTGSDVALRSLPFALALYPKPEPRYWGTTE